MVELVSVSIYSNNKRVKMCPDSEGLFLVPNFNSKSGIGPFKKIGAVDLVQDNRIKHMDPVLYLSDGTRMRVYQGGDPSGLMIMAISLCEKHDKKHKKKKPLYKKRKSKYPKLVISDDVEPYDFDYPWIDHEDTD